MTNDELARAFSGHRFHDTFDHLADDVVWNLVGGVRLEGRDAVVDACRQTEAENESVTTTWLRFVGTGDGDVVAVDAIARYEGQDGVTAVSSCDVYEFVEGALRTITSYTAEVDPGNPYASSAAGG
jgi:ketosteroid isomerase-like protein